MRLPSVTLQVENAARQIVGSPDRYVIRQVTAIIFERSNGPGCVPFFVTIRAAMRLDGQPMGTGAVRAMKML